MWDIIPRTRIRNITVYRNHVSHNRKVLNLHRIVQKIPADLRVCFRFLSPLSSKIKSPPTLVVRWPSEYWLITELQVSSDASIVAKRDHAGDDRSGASACEADSRSGHASQSWRSLTSKEREREREREWALRRGCTPSERVTNEWQMARMSLFSNFFPRCIMLQIRSDGVCSVPPALIRASGAQYIFWILEIENWRKFALRSFVIAARSLEYSFARSLARLRVSTYMCEYSLLCASGVHGK